MKILIVEDNPIQRVLLQHILKGQNFEVLAAACVDEAVRYLETEAEIRLVISDIMMPGVSGLDLLRRMKGSIEWRDIPVIMCSAVANTGNVLDAARLGCQHYVLKPYSKDVLLKKVTDALATREPMLFSEPQLRKQFGLDAEGLKSLILEFHTFFQEQIDGLEQRIKNPDYKGPSIDFNKLAENTDMLGVDKLKRAISDLKIKADYINLEKQDYLLLQVELKHVNRCLKEMMES